MNDLYQRELLNDFGKMSLALTARKHTRRKTIKSKVNCYKCGGIGHKQNVCPSRDDGDFKTPPSKPPCKSCVQAFSVMESCDNETSNANSRDLFVFDTGALAHVTNRRDLLHDFTAVPPDTIAEIRLGTPVEIVGTGTLKFRLPDGTILPVEDVRYAPFYDRNLISVSRATSRGAVFDMLRDGVFDVNLDLQVAARTSPDKCALYKFLFPCLPARNASAGTTLGVTNAHSRLGHSNQAADDIKFESKDGIYDACARGKATSSVPKALDVSRSSVKAPLELVHSTVCGPISQPSLNKNLYYVVFVDDYTHFMVVYPIKQKSEVYECAHSYFLQSERFFQNRGGYKPVAFRTDNSGEYMSSKLQRFLKANGIAHQNSTTCSIYPNAVSKRAIRTIKEKSRAMMREASVPICFWAEAVACSTYLLNRLPSTAIDNQMPYQRWYKSLPKLDNLRPFGCMVNARIIEQSPPPWSFRTIRGIMVGYTQNHNEYRIFDLDSGGIVICEDVNFNEFLFPFKNMTTVPPGVPSLDQLMNDAEIEY